MAKRDPGWRRWALRLLGVALLVGAAVPIGVTCVERRQAADLEAREPYRATPSAAGPVVIYFSRSGSTALVARHIANRLDARLIEISAPDYALGLVGWASAMWDARGHAAEIAPATVDLAAHDPIYLGAPIWLYSPAPPIWTFMLGNRFDGKRVVLFNTFNSTFGEEYIDGFRAAVMARGARAFEHRAVRRGRMTRQIAPGDMLKRVDVEWGLAPPGP